MATFSVEYLEDPGSGIVHLRRADPGPAGEARVRLGDRLSCWFDPCDPDLPTDCWIDLGAADEPWLTETFGPESVELRRPDGEPFLEIDDNDLWWAPIGWRLATLEQVRSTPLGTDRPDLLAIEAVVLGDALADAQLAKPSWLRDELAAVLPTLERLGSAELALAPIVARAVAIIQDRLNLTDPALDRLDDLFVEVDSGVSVDEALSGLEPRSAERVPVLMADTAVAGHDQLWTHLPAGLFPDGGFASMAMVEVRREGFKRRLQISMPDASDAGQTLFVRLVDPTADPPGIVAIDALLAGEGRYVTTMDVPAGFDFDRTRVEVVTDLATTLLPDSAHAKRRGGQWAMLALAAERCGRPTDAVRLWRLAERLHEAAGEPALSEIAGSRARNGSPGRRPEPLLAESTEATVTDPGS